MIKKVFKPFWSYDVSKTEEWLSSMAEKGYLLVKLNRGTRHFFFQQAKSKKITYRIGFDKMQGETLSNGLLAEGWTKIFQSGNWYVTSNDTPLEQLKKCLDREGIVKHNRNIMYIFASILIYLTFILFVNLTLNFAAFFQKEPVEVVHSPYWIITYIFIGVGIATWVLSAFSVIKINKTNKKLINENIKRKDSSGSNHYEVRLRKAEEKQLKHSGQLFEKRKIGWMYSPDKLEKWLESMEEQGYNLYRVSKAGTAFYFIIGFPRKVSYCADYQNTSDKSYFDIHKDAGWKSVFTSFGSLQKWSIWSREYSEGEDRPRIYSDKSHQLKHARRIAITYTCMFLPLVMAYLLNIGLSIGLLLNNTINKLQIMNMIFFVLLILIFGSYSIRSWLYYMRLRKQNN
jgi:Protein of unknown function (DUF2812)